MGVGDLVRTILIAGPTASGKSALALNIAERIGGVVVNADSMQVYRELRTLTARPSLEDEARVPHRLYGHVPAAEAYSAGRFAADAAGVLSEIRGSGRIPIIVGGTGLYFRTLLEGLSPIPPVPPDIRAFWRGEAVRAGALGMHEVLAARDPPMAARLRPSDKQRITRALEVLDATGRSLADWQKAPGAPLISAAHAIKLVVAPDRQELHRRSDMRVDAMVAAGALDEVRALATHQLDPRLPAVQALGVRPLMAHICGSSSLEQAVAETKAETRHYIKRQMTWLRRNMSAWKWLSEQEM